MESAHLKEKLDDSHLGMKKNFKRFVVVKYDCWEYANRLWNDMAIYATGLELGTKIVFPSALERIRFLRPLYELYAQYVGRVLHPRDSVWAWGGTVRYLPPTEPLNSKYDSFESLHLLGMLFRNPTGFEKYAVELRAKFGASPNTKKKIDRLLSPLAGRTLLGVHIRQKPFTYFPHGEFLLLPTRTKEILEGYLDKHGLTKDAVALVLVSDTPLPRDLFSNYMQVLVAGNPSLGFHALSRARVVVGTNSSMSNLAAWMGNIPHIVTTEESIDWEYYENRTTFFENKYATFTQKISL